MTPGGGYSLIWPIWEGATGQGMVFGLSILTGYITLSPSKAQLMCGECIIHKLNQP